MVLFRMEITKEIIETGLRTRRDGSIKQSWSSDKYFQVVKDDDGEEFSVRVAKQRVANSSPICHNMLHAEDNPIPYTFTPTTSATRYYYYYTHFTYDNNSKGGSSEHCLQYKNGLESMIAWGNAEISRLGTSGTSFCRTDLMNNFTRTRIDKKNI